MTVLNPVCAVFLFFDYLLSFVYTYNTCLFFVHSFTTNSLNIYNALFIHYIFYSAILKIRFIFQYLFIYLLLRSI